MRKILISAVLFFLAQSFVLAQNADTPALKMSDVQVYSAKNKFGFKDNKGNIVVNADYKKLIRLGKSSWLAQKNNKFGIMDSSGNFIVKPKYRHAQRYFGTYAILGNDNDYGLYNEKGEVVAPPEFMSIDPLFGKMFLTCKNFKYGVIDSDGKQLLKNQFDDIYMPKPTALRIQYEGEWYEIEKMKSSDISLPENVKKITIDNKEYKITHIIENPALVSGYSAVTAADYTLKVFSSISPAYEETIDELMLSQGAETVNIFIKLGWIPKFPYTYAKKYIYNIRTPNNGPLADIKYDLKKQMKN